MCACDLRIRLCAHGNSVLGVQWTCHMHGRTFCELQNRGNTLEVSIAPTTYNIIIACSSYGISYIPYLHLQM